MAKPPKAHFHFKESENLQLGADSEAVSTLQGMLRAKLFSLSSLFDIGYWLLVIGYSTFDVAFPPHPLRELRDLRGKLFSLSSLFDIGYSTFDIRYSHLATKE